MTYQYVTKNGVLKSFDAPSQSAAMSMLSTFADRAPSSGIIAAPAGTQSATQPTVAASAPPTAAEISRALAQNPDYQKYAGNNSVESILSAYQTGDFSGVTDLTGKPFTDAQQKAAVAQAEKALAPAYEAEKTYDTAGVTATLAGDVADYNAFERDQGIGFEQDKQTLDKSAADNGVLFSGARIQKQNDLRTRYANAEADKRDALTSRIGSTARDYQYTYGDGAARDLKSFYQVPGGSTYNPSVATGGARSGSGLSSVYDTGAYKFQGTKPVAQKTAVQTRAASLLANRANKLSLSGVGAKF